MESRNEHKQWNVAEIQLTYKTDLKPSLRPKISSAQDAYQVFIDSWDSTKIELVEQFKAMFLNRANKVLGVLEVSTGGISGTVVDPRLIFMAAIKTAASGFIVAHNHPSGNLTPSQVDISLTKKLKDGGRLLDISCLDHLIVTSEGYKSFADEGLL